MPHEGDNVTTQQILETMRTFQAEVATSKFEIVVSRANNTEPMKICAGICNK